MKAFDEFDQMPYHNSYQWIIFGKILYFCSIYCTNRSFEPKITNATVYSNGWDLHKAEVYAKRTERSDLPNS